MKAIPKEIFNHAKDCDDAFEKIETSLAEVYNAKIFDDEVEGSGFCVKIDTKGVMHEKAGDNKVMIEFSISDGEYSINAIAHNANAEYIEGPLEKDELTHFLTTLTNSQKQGKRVEVKGKFINFGKKRVFLCNQVTLDNGLKESQMTEKQFKKFKQLCKKHKTSPLELMMRDDTLWAELYAKDFLKKAVLLFCLNPTKKTRYDSCRDCIFTWRRKRPFS